jgi:hypothetical protein
MSKKSPKAEPIYLADAATRATFAGVPTIDERLQRALRYLVLVREALAKEDRYKETILSRSVDETLAEAYDELYWIQAQREDDCAPDAYAPTADQREVLRLGKGAVR